MRQTFAITLNVSDEFVLKPGMDVYVNEQCVGVFVRELGRTRRTVSWLVSRKLPLEALPVMMVQHMLPHSAN